ncbi:MAG TPA: Plug domain-containing protein, partial [Planctomycetaceae bacterium]|nr:Plug domain-containing protein [Planctomycetaceae bacterium]
MRQLVALCVLTTCMTAPAAVCAQTASSDGRTAYPAEFFEPFSPSNALQMVERLPGFLLESGASGVRGFGEAAGNVVINGVRPSSKSEGISSVLSRIPASRVVRIEIAPGSAFGADFAGKPQVANVILDDQSGIAGSLETKWVREFTGKLRPNGSASVTISRGAHTVNGSFKLENGANSEEGFDTFVA